MTLVKIWVGQTTGSSPLISLRDQQWYRYAILELSRVNTFQNDRKWIARALELKVGEVNIAIERLVRLEYIDRISKRAPPTPAP